MILLRCKYHKLNCSRKFNKFLFILQFTDWVDYNDYCEYLLIDIEDSPLRRLKASDGVNEDFVAWVSLEEFLSCSSVPARSSNNGDVVANDPRVMDGSLELDFIRLSMEELDFFVQFW